MCLVCRHLWAFLSCGTFPYGQLRRRNRPANPDIEQHSGWLAWASASESFGDSGADPIPDPPPTGPRGIKKNATVRPTVQLTPDV